MEGGVIIAPNHASFIDPPAVGAKIPRELCYLAKKELFPIPLIRQFLQISHSIPIDRRGVYEKYSEGVGKTSEGGMDIFNISRGNKNKNRQIRQPQKRYRYDSGYGRCTDRAMLDRGFLQGKTFCFKDYFTFSSSVQTI